MSTRPADTTECTALDRRAVDTTRLPPVDAVQPAGNGHPGRPMSLSPAAYTIFQKVMRHDPADPERTGRDHFVLSPGHTSLTLYTQLFLAGYELDRPDRPDLGGLRAFRTRNSSPTAACGASRSTRPYKDTLYVGERGVPGTVSTMPEATLDAVAAQGVSYDQVVALLEDEGVTKSETAWQDLLDAVAASHGGGAAGTDSEGVDAE